MAKEGKGIAWIRKHTAHADDACLPWPFWIDKTNGYGRCGFDAKLYWAHRLMCEMAHGPAPSASHQAAHSCGRGHEGCVNPRHLSWKTRSQNQRDRRKHGTSRAKFGHRWKLTPAQVAEIRAQGGIKTQRELAAMYGVTWQTIGMILRRETWTTGDYVGGKPRFRAAS